MNVFLVTIKKIPMYFSLSRLSVKLLPYGLTNSTCFCVSHHVVCITPCFYLSRICYFGILAHHLQLDPDQLSASTTLQIDDWSIAGVAQSEVIPDPYYNSSSSMHWKLLPQINAGINSARTLFLDWIIFICGASF